MNVLLTDGRLRTCLYVARSLGKKGIDVFVGESAWLHPHFYNPRRITTFMSAYCKGYFFYPHYADSDSFISFMAKLAKKYNALISMNEDTIIPICKNSTKFSNILLPSFQDLEIALDKRKVAEKCTKLGIPMPRTFFPQDYTELKSLSKELTYPVFVKLRHEGLMFPRYRICHSEKTLLHEYKALQRIETPIIQEQVKGFGTGLFALFDKKHRLKAYFMHKRIREYPITGGLSTFSESFWNKQVLEHGLKLLKSLNWVGVGMVEFRFDVEHNVPKVLEVNPRFWGSLPLAIFSGVDFPYLLYKLIIGEDFTPVLQYKLNVRCRFTKDFDVLLKRFQEHRNLFETAKALLSSVSAKNADFDRKDPYTSASSMVPTLKKIVKIPKKIVGL
jgi:predicted ATP-grasp superfamily ATP-dependent carboligase